MGKVKGEDVVLKYSDDQFPFLCARSIQFNIDKELIETSITGSGAYKTYTQAALSWGGNLEGLTLLTGGTQAGDMGAIYNLITTEADFQITWYEEDVTGTYYLQKSGSCYLTNVSEISSFDNVVTFNAEFVGTGPITIVSDTI
jgi:hypothetical protein